MYIYMYIYICIYTYIYTYIHIYISYTYFTQMAKRSQEGRGTCQISTDAKHECQHAHVWAEKPYYSGYNPVVYPDVIQFVGERSVEDLVNEVYISYISIYICVYV